MKKFEDWEEPDWGLGETYEAQVKSIPFKYLPFYVDHDFGYIKYTSRKRLAGKEYVSFDTYNRNTRFHLSEVGGWNYD